MRLSVSTSPSEFKSSYWYANELKKFASVINVPNYSSLRKDQLEKLILRYLETGTLPPIPSRSTDRSQLKDSNSGLTKDLPVRNYTNDRETKMFIQTEAQRVVPGLKKKSGALYWLNRWREQQAELGNVVTYGDLVNRYIQLCNPNERLPRIPSARFNNFVSDYLKYESAASRKDALRVWNTLKTLTIPKNYQAWKDYQRRQMRRGTVD